MKKSYRSAFNSRQYMYERDFELYYYSDLHFHSVSLHSHSCNEIYFFWEGEVEMEINGCIYPLHSGDVLVMPAGLEHKATVRSGETTYRRFVFWLSEEFCDTLRNEAPEYLYLFDRTLETGNYKYSMDPINFSMLRSKLLTLLEELHTDNFGRDAKIYLYVRDLLLSFSRIVYQRANIENKKEQHSSYQAIIDYIASHLDEDLSLSALSEKFYLNKYYIAHLIQENTGLSIHQYITKKRLSSCVDAMNAGQSISLCCAQNGFPNYSVFYRAFRKEYGCSPSVYVKEHPCTATKNREDSASEH